MFTTLAQQLQNIIDHLYAQLQTLDEPAWTTRPAPGKWSRQEIIGHLVDSANNNIQRFVRATYEERFRVVYHQDEWVQAQRYQEADARELLQLWYLINKQIVRILAHYPADREKVQVNTGKTTENFHTVAFLAQDYLDHLLHHAKAIAAIG